VLYEVREKRSTHSGKSERVSGDLIWYFCIHNLISIIIFFFVTSCFGIYSGNTLLLSDMFTKPFWELVLFRVFPISILSSIGARITAILVINESIKIKDRKKRVRSTKKWSELNTGINKLGLVFLASGLITSFIYTVGLVGILQYAIFNESTYLTLIVIYIGLKIGIFYGIRWFVGAKL